MYATSARVASCSDMAISCHDLWRVHRRWGQPNVQGNPPAGDRLAERSGGIDLRWIEVD